MEDGLFMEIMVNMDLHGEKHDLYMIYIYYHLVIEQFAMENHHF